MDACEDYKHETIDRRRCNNDPDVIKFDGKTIVSLCCWRSFVFLYRLLNTAAVFKPLMVTQCEAKQVKVNSWPSFLPAWILKVIAASILGPLAGGRSKEPTSATKPKPHFTRANGSLIKYRGNARP